MRLDRLPLAPWGDVEIARCTFEPLAMAGAAPGAQDLLAWTFAGLAGLAAAALAFTVACLIAWPSPGRPMQERRA